MTNTTKAKRASIRVGELELDVFMLPNGDYTLSQTQVAEAVEKEEFAFRDFLKGKSPQALPYKCIEPQKLAVEGSKSKIKIVPKEIAVAFWTKEALRGNVKARVLLYNLGETFGLQKALKQGLTITHNTCTRKRKTGEEKQVQLRLAKRLRGKCEVETPVGKIDILTATEVIEVKIAKGWKSALGQVLAYSDYYPNHNKRVHLFGKLEQSYLSKNLSKIKETCSRQGVTVTFE